MLLTLETDIVFAKNHSKWLQQNFRMNENGRERIKTSGFFLEYTIFFLHCYLFLSISRARGPCFFILYFICADVQLYFLGHHVLTGTYLNSFDILYVPLLCVV